MTTYFISDIHLHAGSVENSQLLLNFLESKGQHADAIYILGDLFALWLGDDLNTPYATPIFAAIKKLTSQAIPVYFMRGNRDFLVGKQFCAATGCKLLPDPTVISLYGQTVLLTHGDLLCSLDIKYQKYRSFVQHPIIKAMFMQLPKWLRYKIGNWVKQQAKSKQYTNLQPEIYDVAPETVNSWLQQHSVKVLIHGHTHKPAIHNLGTAVRIVLGDWEPTSAKILAYNATGYELQDLRVVS